MAPKTDEQMKRLPTKLRPLEFEVFRARPVIGGAELGRDHHVLACVSGGADSVAMARVLLKLKKRWGFQLTLLNVHHGDASLAKQTRFRDRAAKLTRALAQELGIVFVGIRVDAKGESEEQLREARLKAVARECQRVGALVVAMGHNADDVFETRLMRLMRGTGLDGLRAMSTVDPFPKSKGRLPAALSVWRPLLAIRRCAIEDYLASENLKRHRHWLVDPSNRETKYLRNAIRERLLPTLETVRPGSAAAMARSLQLIAESTQGEWPQTEVEVVRLEREPLRRMTAPAARKILAKWMNANGVRSFSKSHLDEILKRINAPNRHLTFKICGHQLRVGDQIELARGGLDLT